MWPVFFFVYAGGSAMTAMSVLRNRVFARSNLVSACSIVLWPAYWSLFLTLLFLNRTRSAAGGPSKRTR